MGIPEFRGLNPAAPNMILYMAGMFPTIDTQLFTRQAGASLAKKSQQ
jgi:hypothetical protein